MARLWRNVTAALVLAFAAGTAHAWECIPAPWGSGVGFAVGSDTKARAYGYWCPSQYEPAKPVFYAGPLSAFEPNWENIAATLLMASPAERKAAHDKYTVTWPKDASGATLVPYDVWPVFSAVRTAWLKNRPPDPIWKVAPNPGYTTRAAFAYSGGIRATTATARATVDATCYCDTRDVVGSTVYCAVNTARTWMSVCTKRN